MKFNESQFPVKEKSLAQPGPVPLSDHQFLNKLDSHKDSDDDLDLVTLDQPLTGPSNPGPPPLRLPQSPILPLAPMGGERLQLPEVSAAATSQYSLHP